MTKITVAKGDGIGPEIIDSTLKVLDASGAKLEYEFIEIGKSVYERGYSSGIEPSSWESLRKNKVFLKAPITTPQGGGYKSLNVTIRKTLGLFANVRPCASYHPAVYSNHPKMDLVIIRENEEDLYAGIEHQQTEDVVQCLKLISRPGCEKIVRYAFDYARQHGRKKVSCFSKDNIMKLTDGMFHQVFDEIAKEYSDIENDHFIIDIGTARIASAPEKFDVIVTLNLYGDIISDVAAEVTGSVGLAGSANIGDHIAMFEAIHGSAPDIAGLGIANPTGLLNATVMMLVHIGQNSVAENIHNAILKTIEEGIHTADIFKASTSKKRVSTEEFTTAIIERLGEFPKILKPAFYPSIAKIKTDSPSKDKAQSFKQLVGIDVFIDSILTAEELANKLNLIELESKAKLQMISNRGVKVWPQGFPETFLTRNFRCRFLSANSSFDKKDVLEILSKIDSAGLDFIKTEHLYNFDGKAGYSLSQGQ